MTTVNTEVTPFVWNYTHPKGTDFSRNLEFNVDLTGSSFAFEILGAKSKIIPKVTLVNILNNISIVNISVTAEQTAMMSETNSWFFKMAFGYGAETFICWTGQFNLSGYV